MFVSILDQADVFHTVEERRLHRFFRGLESGISYRDNAPRDYFITLFTHLASYREICEALYNAGLSHLLKDEFDRVFLSIHGGEYDDYKSYFHAGGIYNVFLLWLMRGCPETPEELADKLDNIMTR